MRGPGFEWLVAWRHLRDPDHKSHRTLITGVVCGVRVETIEDPLMQQIRYMDKLVDELAKGRALERVLRD